MVYIVLKRDAELAFTQKAMVVLFCQQSSNIFRRQTVGAFQFLRAAFRPVLFCPFFGGSVMIDSPRLRIFRFFAFLCSAIFFGVSLPVGSAASLVLLCVLDSIIPFVIGSRLLGFCLCGQYILSLGGSSIAV